MTAKFFAILTNQGAAALANATALGTRVDLTHIAVGDGGGVLPTPDAAQTALKGEKRRAAINLLTIDPGNDSQIIAEQIIPENEGGWWIREIGLFSADGTLIAVANCPETYKPQLQEGSGRTQTIRMVLIVSSTEAVTLKIDPSVVLATRQYVDDVIIEVKTYVDDEVAKCLPLKGGDLTGALRMAYKIGIYALNSTGGQNNLAVLGNSSYPDTVILGGSSIPTVVLSSVNPDVIVSGKRNTLYHTGNKPSAADVGAITRSDAPVGIPQPWPTANAPSGWLKCNGATFDKTKYPLLADAYPSGSLPDLRGEFIRGWDDRRGVDSGRILLSTQGDMFARHNHYVRTTSSVTETSDAGDPARGQVPGSTNTSGQNGEGKSIGMTGGNETRPRNIAFNYIVRAA